MSSFTSARVLAQFRGRWLVASASGEPMLVPARRLADAPVTGDYVQLDDGGAIAAIEPRGGTIVRREAGGAGAQVLAANVDLALLVEPLPEPNVRRLERLAALAASGGVARALVLTKADLADDAHVTAARMARTIGAADALAVSALADAAPRSGSEPHPDAAPRPGSEPHPDAAPRPGTTPRADAAPTPDGSGVAALRGLLVPGTTAVLLGASGAGKSTLVNALLGTERQRTGAVRASDRRGRHTTVTRELLTLPNGAHVVDTPGIREVGLWDGTGDAFDDVDTLAASCRFSDCGHDSEPGCAVRAALPADRIAAWRKLQREQAWVDDRRAAARARAQLGREHERRRRRM